MFEGDVIYNITKVSKKEKEREKSEKGERKKKRDGGCLVTDTKKVLTLIRFDLIPNAHTHIYTHRRQI